MLSLIHIFVVKMPVNLVDKEEKVNQIRIYSGAKYETVNEVEAGGVCAVTGLVSSYIGQGFGVEKGTAAPFLEPVLTYQMILPDGADTTKVLRELKMCIRDRIYPASCRTERWRKTSPSFKSPA